MVPAIYFPEFKSVSNIEFQFSNLSSSRCITANVAPPFIGNISPSHIHDNQALPASCLTQSCPSPGPRHRSSLGSGQLSPATVDQCNGPDTHYNNSPAFSAQEPHRCGHCGCFKEKAPTRKGLLFDESGYYIFHI